MSVEHVLAAEAHSAGLTPRLDTPTRPHVPRTHEPSCLHTKRHQAPPIASPLHTRTHAPMNPQPQVGQLLHGEAFSLFEAMSALEVGNPKMDAAAATAAAAEPPSLAALLADPAAAPLELPAPLLLAVLDRLAALEASWQCGGSAMQTVFSCLYMMNIDRWGEGTGQAKEEHGGTLQRGAWPGHTEAAGEAGGCRHRAGCKAGDNGSLGPGQR